MVSIKSRQIYIDLYVLGIKHIICIFIIVMAVQTRLICPMVLISCPHSITDIGITRSRSAHEQEYIDGVQPSIHA